MKIEWWNGELMDKNIILKYEVLIFNFHEDKRENKFDEFSNKFLLFYRVRWLSWD
jgi:hypothetical protein